MNNDVVVAMAVFVAAMFGAYVSVSINNSQWRQDLVAAGVGQYCPDTGDFAVKGQCP